MPECPRCHGEWIEGRHPPESCYWCGYPAPEDSEEVVLLPHGGQPHQLAGGEG